MMPTLTMLITVTWLIPSKATAGGTVAKSKQKSIKDVLNILIESTERNLFETGSVAFRYR